jgi:Ca-activated chloride channel family protein
MKNPEGRMMGLVGLAAILGAFAYILSLSGCATKSPTAAAPLPGAVNEAAHRQTPGSPTMTGILTDPAFRVVTRAMANRDPGLPAIPGSLPSATDELWVIARSSEPSQQAGDDSPGSGSLVAQIEEKQVTMPLKHTDVRASVSGYIGSVQVVQQFHNPYDTKIEAVYVFPLPHNAAVSEFIITIGERRIRGIIRERQEAEEIYQVAKRQGYVASLLTEERPNIFTQSVANIEPGKAIDVTIKYFHTLAYVDGWYEFEFPMVVGPRFNPPGTTGGIGAVPVGQHGASGQKTEIQYLKPNERSGHEISLRVDVDAGVAIEEFECRTHAVSHESPSSHQLAVALQPQDNLPNLDFVLRYRVAGDQIKSSLLTHRDARGGYFTLMIYPPAELASLARQPLELVFVLDCSGSMSGMPIAHAKAAVERGLRLLRPGDSFQLINFSMSASQLGRAPIEATPQNIQLGLRYLNSLRGGGGTMMIEGIKAALDFPHDPQRLRFVCFLTDGYIGNEAEILGEVHKRLGASRIFSFGVGSSPNRYLLDHLAKAGRGAVAYLGPRDDGAKVMEAFFIRISHPALTDLQVDWGELDPSEVFPQSLPDLFVGRPGILTGRFAGKADTQLRISGKAANEAVAITIPANLASDADEHLALPSVWARMKIAYLAGQSIFTPDAPWSEQIKQVALEYGLMSAFTAFVAVDSTQRTDGIEGVTIPVAVPVPEGVEYKTTIPEE